MATERGGANDRGAVNMKRLRFWLDGRHPPTPPPSVLKAPVSPAGAFHLRHLMRRSKGVHVAEWIGLSTTASAR